MQRDREVWVDWLRVLACFLVMVVHSVEPFYLGGDGASVQSVGEGVWAAVFLSLSRACVALFVVASAYLQFPIKYSTGEFFKRRVLRILPPFVIWSIFYALYWGEPVNNFKDLLLNFNYTAGHLWYVYMLLGLYLLMPMLSPWAAKVGKKELRFYIGIWLFTTIIPLIKDWVAGGPMPLVAGPSGVPQTAKYPLWGEASWNNYGLFYYFSGLVGYMLIGLYLRKFVGELSWKKTLSLACPFLLAGFAITGIGFLRRIMISSGGVLPFDGQLQTSVWWETTLCNDTLGTALVTIGYLLIIRKLSFDGIFYRNVVLPVSKASYGMYLGHMVALAAFSAIITGWLGTGECGSLGFWTAAAEIILTAVCSYVTVALVAVLLHKLPVVGKLIVG